MTGLVNYAKNPHSVELRELPIPEIGEDDVLFSVKAAGICGSDLHQYSGKQSWQVNYPVVLGHEFAGVIARVGARVQGFEEGDRVVSETAVQIDVSDDGPGIPLALRDKVFEPFFKGDSARPSSGRAGFGLGLSIARDIVRRHGGAIDLLNRAPRGLTVRLSVAGQPGAKARNLAAAEA